MDQKHKKIDELLAAEKVDAERAGVFFRNIMRNSRDVLYRYNFKTQAYDYLSNSIEHLIGYTPREVMSRGVDLLLEIIHPDDKADFMLVYEGLLDDTMTDSMVHMEYRIRHKDGRWRWQSDVISTIRNQVGEIEAVCGSIRDLTLETQQKQQLQTVFESSQDCILVWDRDYNYLYANQAAIDHVNTTPDKVIGKNIRDGLGHIPDFMSLWMSRIDEVFESQKSRRVEDAVPVGDRLVYSESVLSPVFYPGGEMFAVSVVYRDVTEQRQLQYKLFKSEQKYKQLYEDAPVALFRTSLDGILLDFNRACFRLFGYPDEENNEDFLNKFCVTDGYVDKGRRDEFIRLLRKYKKVRHFEAELNKADDQTVWVSISAELFPESGYIEGTMYDITIKKILTKAEKRVLKFLVQGLSNKQIARNLNRSVRTIEDHRARVMRKMGVDSAFGLAKKALNYNFDALD